LRQSKENPAKFLILQFPQKLSELLKLKLNKSKAGTK